MRSLVSKWHDAGVTSNNRKSTILRSFPSLRHSSGSMFPGLLRFDCLPSTRTYKKLGLPPICLFRIHQSDGTSSGPTRFDLQPSFTTYPKPGRQQTCHFRTRRLAGMCNGKTRFASRAIRKTELHGLRSLLRPLSSLHPSVGIRNGVTRFARGAQRILRLAGAHSQHPICRLRRHSSDGTRNSMHLFCREILQQQRMLHG